MAGIDPDLVRHALLVAQRHGFAEIRLEVEDAKFRARRHPAVAAMPVDVAPSEEVADAAPGEVVIAVESPCVGYFQPGDAMPSVGDRIEAGTVIGSVLALGISTDTVCEVAGEVVEVSVEADQAVDYGAQLIRVKVGDA